jgi:hypothetical protein
MSCDILTPISAFQSTNLNSKIDSFNRLGERIVRSLGAPLISVEIHQDQLFENISHACEMFSKFAGYTKEYLVFDSNLYERGKGIRLDVLYTLSNQTLSLKDKLAHQTTSTSTSPYLKVPQKVYIVSCPLTGAVFLNNPELSANFTLDLQKNQIFDKSTYDLLNSSLELSNFFTKSSTSYIGVTGYHTALNQIPRSVFSGDSNLYSKYTNGILLNQELNDADYAQISSYTVNFAISNFFVIGTDYTITYNIVSPLIKDIFLDNQILSSLYGDGIESLSSITDLQFNYISSNLTDISFNYFVSSFNISSYEVSPSISSNIFSKYENLSSEYPDGIIDNRVIAQSALDLINAETNPGIPINLFFELSVLSSYNSVNDIPKELFLNNPSLSDIYGTEGIIIDRNFSKTDFDNLISNQPNLTLNYFLSSEVLSSYSISPAMSSNIFAGYPSLITAFENGFADNQIVPQSAIDLINTEVTPGFPLNLFIELSVVSSYNSINNIPKELFLENPSLSDAYGTFGILTDTNLSKTDFENLILNQPNLTLNHFLSSEFDAFLGETIYTVTTPIISSIIENYPSLFSTYFDGLTAGLILSTTEYDTITSTIDPGFDINYFFSLSTVSSCNVVNSIPADLFLDIESLSAEYGVAGLISPTSLDVSQYNNISSNINFLHFRYFYDLYETNTLYTVTTPIISSIIENYPSLFSTYSDGLTAGLILNQTEYNSITSVIDPGFNTNYFFLLSTVSSYNAVNSIPANVFLDNPSLSDLYGSTGIATPSSFNVTDYEYISTNLNSIPFSYYYQYDHIDTYYSVVTSISSEVFAGYSQLSSVYPNGIEIGTILSQYEYNFITSETSNSFELSDFFKLSSTPYQIHTCTTSLCPILFETSPVLSSVYTQGISADSVFEDSEYSVLSSNLNTNLNNFLSTTPQSSTYYNYFYTAIDYVHKDVTDNTSLSSTYPNGISAKTTINEANYNILNSVSDNLARSYFCESVSEGISNSCAEQCNQDTSTLYSNMFDYDVMDYRKVISVTDFEEGSTTGINTLFTIEQTLAQQTYFSYAMGNYGFDLISWWTVKNWLETREKVLALKRSCEFDDRTQYLRMYPEPTSSTIFYGALACYVERPLRDLIKEPWVYRYALALSKITVGTVRGKYGSTTAFGGQIFAQELLQQGITERDALEQQLYTTSAGFGDADPVSFFIG